MSTEYKIGDVDPTPDVCGEQGPSGWLCSWPPNHDDDHVAGGDGRILDTWARQVAAT